MTASAAGDNPFEVFLVAGEESGDQLGAGLMRALRARLGERVRFRGVGGSRMAAEGLVSLFPMQEISLHGISEVLTALRRVLGRIRETAGRIVQSPPAVLVLIDSPDFNLRVGERVRRQAPHLPIVDYVSPTVWVWRAGRARKMARFVDEVLAILPFEPDVHRRLGGPSCTYVGHPLIERLADLRPKLGERLPVEDAGTKTLIVLPGSRRSEMDRLLPRFGAALALIAAKSVALDVVIPAVPWLAAEIRARTARWAVPPVVVEGEAAKFAAFRRAHAALAASGTVTLELALAHVPMAVAYRVDAFMRLLKPYVRARMKGPVKSIVLPNLILAEKAVPEFIDEETTPEALAGAILPLLRDSGERRSQLAAFARLDEVMSLGAETPSGRAAEVVLATAARKDQRRFDTGT